MSRRLFNVLDEPAAPRIGLLDNKEFVAAFERWRMSHFGRHNPYPIEAITAFGAGWQARDELHKD